jgi:hypothetical protein
VGALVHLALVEGENLGSEPSEFSPRLRPRRNVAQAQVPGVLPELQAGAASRHAQRRANVSTTRKIMPYIIQERRKQLDAPIDLLATQLFNMGWTAGDFNYCVFRIMKRLFTARASYSTANDLLGALVCCGQEFYRRILSNYESLKIKENGDVCD